MRRLSLISVLWVLSTGAIGGNLKNDSIVGHWRALFDDCEHDLELIINDSLLIFKSEPGTTFLQHKYMISESDSLNDSYTLKLFDSETSIDYGRNFETIFGKNDTAKVKIFIDDNILSFLAFKGGDLSSQYQIVEAYYRETEESKIDYKPNVSTMFYLPEGFRGYSWVAFEQQDGEIEEVDIINGTRGIRIFRIPDSGILKSQSEPMPDALAKREFEFYYLSGNEKSISLINPISRSCLSYIKTESLTESEITELGFDPDRVYVYYYRYNNPGRREINKIFGEEIIGQVFWFRVDTLRNFLKSEPMIPRFQKSENN